MLSYVIAKEMRKRGQYPFVDTDSIYRYTELNRHRVRQNKISRLSESPHGLSKTDIVHVRLNGNSLMGDTGRACSILGERFHFFSSIKEQEVKQEEGKIRRKRGAGGWVEKEKQQEQQKGEREEKKTQKDTEKY